MSELTQKLQQLRELKELKSHPGWLLLADQIGIRIIADQVAMTEAPEKINAEGRTYLAGRLRGATDSVNLLDAFISGLESEVEHLKEMESQNGHDNADDPASGSGADSDASAARDAASIDPGT